MRPDSILDFHVEVNLWETTKMDSVINKFNHFARDIAGATQDFSPMTWAVIAVGTVMFGYMMLKGINIQGR